MFEGGCHCGAVRFRVTTNKRELLDCSCNVCTKKGILHLIVDGEALEILRGQEALSEYRYGSRVAKHLFCKHCGIHSFYVPRSHPGGYSINFRCLDGYRALLDDFAIRPFDGQKWESNVHQIR